MTVRTRHIEFGAHIVAGLALALLALAIFSWLAFEIHAGETLRFDGLVRAGVHRHASPALTLVMKGFTVIGASVCVFVLLATSFATFWLAGLRRQAVLMLVAMVGALALELSLKHAFHRARPEPYFNVPLPASYSFPSGHALAAACLYGMLAVLTTGRVKRRDRKVAIWTVCAFMILMIGLSRIYLGVHYPSDVLAGYMAACVWLGMLYLAIERFKSSSAVEASRAKPLSSPDRRT